MQKHDPHDRRRKLQPTAACTPRRPSHGRDGFGLASRVAGDGLDRRSMLEFAMLARLQSTTPPTSRDLAHHNLCEGAARGIKPDGLEADLR